MPMSPLRYCSEPGCREKIRNKPRCEIHAKERNRIKNQHDYEVKKAKNPFYKTAAWKRLRIEQLAKSPLCEWVYAGDQRKCGRPAIVVDHIVPRESGGADHPDNFQSLCHSHHSKKTAIQTGFGRNNN